MLTKENLNRNVSPLFLFFLWETFKKEISSAIDQKKRGKENPPKKEEKKYLMSRSNRFQVVCLMLKGKCNSLSVKIHPGSKKKRRLKKREKKGGRKKERKKERIEAKVFSEKN